MTIEENIERSIVMQDASRATRREFRNAASMLRTTFRTTIAMLPIMLLVALIPAIRPGSKGLAVACHFVIIPILACIPPIMYARAQAKWWWIISLQIGESIPQNKTVKLFGRSIRIGEFFEFARRELHKLLRLALTVPLAGLYLALVPVHRSPILIPLLVLLSVCLWLAILAKYKWLKIALIVAVVLMSLLFFQDEFKQSAAYARSAASDAKKRVEAFDGHAVQEKASKALSSLTAMVPHDATPAQTYNPNRFTDDNDNINIIDKRDWPYNRFKAAIPVGYWTDAKFPTVWHGKFHGFPVIGHTGLRAYLKALNRDPIGPINWRGHTTFYMYPADEFWIQATEPDEVVEFVADDATHLPDPPKSGLENVGAGLEEPRATAIAKAICTPEANAANFSGTATVSFWINPDGTTRDFEIIQSTGIPSLDIQMIEATKRYRFTPATMDGKAVPFHVAALTIDLEHPCHQ